MAQSVVSESKAKEPEVMVFGKQNNSTSHSQSGGIQVLQKGPKQSDGSHPITPLQGDGKGLNVSSVDANGVYRDKDGNMALNPNEDKELLHLKRRGFYYQNRLIFEWIQTLEDVTIYIAPPKVVKSKMLHIAFTSSHLTVGMKGKRPFIDDDLSHPIDSGSSTWFMDEDGITISLSKRKVGESWMRVIKQQEAMNVFEAQKIKKSMMLERFARENPHMDFSGAKFDGQCPEPTEFLDGISMDRFHKDVQ